MRKIVFDTNVLLDYAGIGEGGAIDAAHAAAHELCSVLWSRGDGFIMTPTSLKDFQYMLQRKLKAVTRESLGMLTDEGAAAAQEASLAMVDTLMEMGTAASETLTDCRMARVMCKTHSDYEDNLVAAVAMRIGADCIVTRDADFAKHCPVSCLSPADALAHIQAGVL